MIQLLFLLPVFAGWPLEETGVYRKLRLDEVELRPDGAVYVVDYDNALIKLFGADGNKLVTIGGKGEGPGDLLFPTSLGYEAGGKTEPGRLFVYDSGNYQVSIYDAGGRFLQRLRVPENIEDPIRVRDGWVYGDWDLDKKPARFYRADHDFGQVRAIHEIPDPGRGGGMIITRTERGVHGSFGAIRRRPHFKVDRARDRAYLVDAKRFVITVFKASTGERLRVIQRNERPMPFDNEWGEQRLLEVLENQQGITRQMVEADFPEYFPAIRSMRIDPDGYLVINRWRGNPDERFYTIVLDETGAVMNGRFSWEAVRRLVGQARGMAYVLTFDSDAEEAGITLVNPEEIESFILENPLPAGSVYRTISRGR
ncbi:MAG: hypothetical protein QNK37_32760 [Acidobacteriota bacterium]|nr:hypothetical protein [Acidobacteriota bacterium]